MWLLAPLISKLPSAVQGRVLKVAGKKCLVDNKILIFISELYYSYLFGLRSSIGEWKYDWNRWYKFW